MKSFILISFCFFSVFAFGRYRASELKDGRFILFVGGEYHFTDSSADDLSGAVYTQKLTNPIVASGGMGYRLFHFLYLGARYEYWIARRAFSIGSSSQTDTLSYQNVAGEIGYYTGNPRIHWLLTAAYHHPLELKVKSEGASSGTYTHSPNPAGYSARLTLGVKVNSVLALRFEGGYRHADFGGMYNGSTSLLPAQDKLILSGPFVGFGLGFHF